MSKAYSNSQIKLNSPVTSVPLIGPSYAKRLESLGIYKVKDLLYHFPTKYIDTREITPVVKASSESDDPITIDATVGDTNSFYTRSRKFIHKAKVSDETGHIDVIWFNQRYLSKSIKKGVNVKLHGKVQLYQNKPCMVSPDYEIDYQDGKKRHLGIISPVYPLTAGVSQKWLRSRINYLIDQIKSGELRIRESLSKKILEEHNFISLEEALVFIHSPEKESEHMIARERLSFEELYNIMYKVLLRKKKHLQKKGIPISVDTALTDKFTQLLPFKLTKSQNAAIKEIHHDFGRETAVDRLVSGDVGSGKTVIALEAMLQAANSGYKAVLMAPTTILAKQHIETVNNLNLDKLGISVEGLVGKPTNPSINFNKVKSADFIIGTHAILHHQQILDNVGLVVIDEQHRFGVKQRNKLIAKFKSFKSELKPHRITLTATPIPRTLALTFFGDQDITQVKELPKGRKPVKTAFVRNPKREELFGWMEDQIKNHSGKAFVVCPLIEESDKLQTKAVETTYKEITKRFPESNPLLVHGRISPEEKQRRLKAFRNGTSRILVATPVIEVGLDIPDANIMLIEGAERFGLAQLHQLRGRIGRGEKKSFCFVTTENQSRKTIDRINFFCKTVDGFKLAEYDLGLRGPGEVYGYKQAGIPELKIASLADLELVKKARKSASDKLNI